MSEEEKIVSEETKNEEPKEQNSNETEIKKEESSNKLENSPENQYEIKLKIEKTFENLSKIEQDFPEKINKFWEEISEIKIPLGEILTEIENMKKLQNTKNEKEISKNYQTHENFFPKNKLSQSEKKEIEKKKHKNCKNSR